MKERVRDDVLSVGTAKLINGAASFLIRIYPVRFLDPDSYGVLNLGLTCLMLFDALVGSALDLGTMGLIAGGRTCEGSEVRPEEKAAVRLKLGLGVVLLGFFALTGEWFGNVFLHGPGGRQFFLVLSAAGTAILVLRSAQLYFQARLRFRVFAAIDLAHSAMRVLLVGVVLYGGWTDALSILACFGFAPAIVVVAFFFYARTGARWGEVRSRWASAREVLRTSGPIVATFSVGTIVSRLDMFLLAWRGTPAQLGLYGAAFTLATIPEVAGTYLAPAFLPRILPARKAGTFFGWFRRFHLVTFLALGGALAIGLAVGRPAIAWLLPSRYALSSELVQVLLPGTLAAASVLPLTLNFLMLTRPRSFLIVDLAAAPILIACFWVLVPEYGAVAAAAITCAHKLVRAGVIQPWAWRVARRPDEGKA